PCVAIAFDDGGVVISVDDESGQSITGAVDQSITVGLRVIEVFLASCPCGSHPLSKKIRIDGLAKCGGEDTDLNGGVRVEYAECEGTIFGAIEDGDIAGVSCSSCARHIACIDPHG